MVKCFLCCWTKAALEFAFNHGQIFRLIFQNFLFLVILHILSIYFMLLYNDHRLSEKLEQLANVENEGSCDVSQLIPGRWNVCKGRWVQCELQLFVLIHKHVNCLCCTAGEMFLFCVLLALNDGPLNIVNAPTLDSQASKLLTVHILMVCKSLLSLKLLFKSLSVILTNVLISTDCVWIYF